MGINETQLPDVNDDNPCRGIGWAIDYLRQGYRLTRGGWNGPGQYIGLWEPTANDDMTLPFIYIKTVQGDLVPWLALQTDILATDWDTCHTVDREI